jgi:conjugal transfer pilus assembly protein TraB
MGNLNFYGLGLVSLLTPFFSARAQQGNPLPEPTKTVQRTTSLTEVYEKETQYKKKYAEEAEKRRLAEEELAKIRSQVGKSDGSLNPIHVATPDVNINENKSNIKTSPLIKKVNQKKMQGKRLPIVPVAEVDKDSIVASYVQHSVPIFIQKPLVFSVTQATITKETSTVVPLGSYVKARVLTGVEANDQEPFPMLLQLDYAFVGPNKTKIDLSHCFMIAKTKANLSTERVMAETQDISCVRDNGEHFKRNAKGFIAGEDSTFGMTGELISRQGQVLMTAVLANLAKGAGEAVALANSATQVVTGPGGAIAQSTRISGNTGAYVAGKSITDAAQMIADWYLEHARKLMPSIAIGSGRDVWVVLLDTIQVPPLPVNIE